MLRWPNTEHKNSVTPYYSATTTIMIPVSENQKISVKHTENTTHKYSYSTEFRERTSIYRSWSMGLFRECKAVNNTIETSSAICYDHTCGGTTIALWKYLRLFSQYADNTRCGNSWKETTRYQFKLLCNLHADFHTSLTEYIV